MTIAEALDGPFERLERQLLQMAEAMPEDKYCFRPTPEVRTFGEQLRHVSAVQWVVAAALLETTPPVDVGDGDSGPLSMTAKPEVLNYARASFAYIRQAIRTVSDRAAFEMVPHPFDPQHTKASQLGLIAGYLCHGWEHYGQMVVYERMNGIVPSASRLS
jgi:hypothetical protein